MGSGQGREARDKGKRREGFLLLRDNYFFLSRQLG